MTEADEKRLAEIRERDAAEIRNLPPPKGRERTTTFLLRIIDALKLPSASDAWKARATQAESALAAARERVKGLEEALENALHAIEGEKNKITHPYGRRADCIDSMEQAKVDALQAVLDECCAIRDAALTPETEIAREIAYELRGDQLPWSNRGTAIMDRALLADRIAAAIEKDRAERDSALDDLLARYPATITEWAEAIRTLRTEIAEER